MTRMRKPRTRQQTRLCLTYAASFNLAFLSEKTFLKTARLEAAKRWVDSGAGLASVWKDLIDQGIAKQDDARHAIDTILASIENPFL